MASDIVAQIDVEPVLVNQSQFLSNADRLSAQVAESFSKIGRGMPLGRITGQASEFERSMAASNARVIAFGASAGSLYAVKSAFDKLISSTVEVERQLKNINVYLGAGSNTLKSFSTQLFKVAIEASAPFEDAAKAAQEFSRQGLSMNEVLKRTKDTLNLVRITGESVEESITNLTSIMNSFGKESLNTTMIVDRLSSVGSKFAVSADAIAEALKRVGSSANDAGVQFDDMVALITAAQHITGRSASVIGNSFKTIFTRLERPKVLDDLEAIGVAVRNANGSILPLMDILKNLSSRYDTLSTSQKSFISETVGGVFQINTLKAVLNDLGGGFSIVGQAANIAANSTGIAQKRIEELNSTLSSQFQQTATSWQQALSNIGNLTFSPFRSGTKGAFNLGTQIAEITNPASTNKGPLGGGGIIGTGIQGLLKGAAEFLGGPGLQMAFGVLMRIGGNLLKFTSQAYKDTVGLDAVEKQRIATNNAVANILKAQDGALLEQLKSGKSMEEVQQAVLAIFRQQLAAVEQINLISKNLTTSIGKSGNMSLVPRMVEAFSPVKAVGYIPEITERSLAQAGGYSAGNVISTNVKNGNFSKSVIANTAETTSSLGNYQWINPPQNSIAGMLHAQKSMAATGINPYMLEQMGLTGGGFVPNLSTMDIFDPIKFKNFPQIHKDLLKDAITRIKRSGYYDRNKRIPISYDKHQRNNLLGIYSPFLRNIIIYPDANSQIYRHEYGHYIDNLLGVGKGEYNPFTFFSNSHKFKRKFSETYPDTKQEYFANAFMDLTQGKSPSEAFNFIPPSEFTDYESINNSLIGFFGQNKSNGFIPNLAWVRPTPIGSPGLFGRFYNLHKTIKGMPLGVKVFHDARQSYRGFASINEKQIASLLAANNSEFTKQGLYFPHIFDEEELYKNNVGNIPWVDPNKYPIFKEIIPDSSRLSEIVKNIKKSSGGGVRGDVATYPFLNKLTDLSNQANPVIRKISGINSDDIGGNYSNYTLNIPGTNYVLDKALKKSSVKFQDFVKKGGMMSIFDVGQFKMPNTYAPIVYWNGGMDFDCWGGIPNALKRENMATGGFGTLSCSPLLKNSSNPLGLAAIDSRNQSNADEAIKQHLMLGQSLSEVQKAHTSKGFVPNLDISDLGSSNNLFMVQMIMDAIAGARGLNSSSWKAKGENKEGDQEKSFWGKATPTFSGWINKIKEGSVVLDASTKKERESLNAYQQNINKINKMTDEMGKFTAGTVTLIEDGKQVQRTFNTQNAATSYKGNQYENQQAQMLQNIQNRKNASYSSGMTLSLISSFGGQMAAEALSKSSPNLSRGISKASTDFTIAGQAMMLFPGSPVGKYAAAGFAGMGIADLIKETRSRIGGKEAAFAKAQDQFQKISTSLDALAQSIANLDNYTNDSTVTFEALTRESRKYQEAMASLSISGASPEQIEKIKNAPNTKTQIKEIENLKAQQSENLENMAVGLDISKQLVSKRGHLFSWSNEYEKTNAYNELNEYAGRSVANLTPATKSLYENSVLGGKSITFEQLRDSGIFNSMNLRGIGDKTSQDLIARQATYLIGESAIEKNPIVRKARQEAMEKTAQNQFPLDMAMRQEDMMKRMFANAAYTNVINTARTGYQYAQVGFSQQAIDIARREGDRTLEMTSGPRTVAGFKQQIEIERAALQTKQKLSESNLGFTEKFMGTLNENPETILSQFIGAQKSVYPGQGGVPTIGPALIQFQEALSKGLSSIPNLSNFIGKGMVSPELKENVLKNSGLSENSPVYQSLSKYLEGVTGSDEQLKLISDHTNDTVNIQREGNQLTQEAVGRYENAIKELQINLDSSILGGVDKLVGSMSGGLMMSSQYKRDFTLANSPNVKVAGMGALKELEWIKQNSGLSVQFGNKELTSSGLYKTGSGNAAYDYEAGLANKFLMAYMEQYKSAMSHMPNNPVRQAMEANIKKRGFQIGEYALEARINPEKPGAVNQGLINTTIDDFKKGLNGSLDSLADFSIGIDELADKINKLNIQIHGEDGKGGMAKEVSDKNDKLVDEIEKLINKLYPNIKGVNNNDLPQKGIWETIFGGTGMGKILGGAGVIGGAALIQYLTKGKGGFKGFGEIKDWMGRTHLPGYKVPKDPIEEYKSWLTKRAEYRIPTDYQKELEEKALAQQEHDRLNPNPERSPYAAKPTLTKEFKPLSVRMIPRSSIPSLTEEQIKNIRYSLDRPLHLTEEELNKPFVHGKTSLTPNQLKKMGILDISEKVGEGQGQASGKYGVTFNRKPIESSKFSQTMAQQEYERLHPNPERDFRPIKGKGKEYGPYSFGSPPLTGEEHWKSNVSLGNPASGGIPGATTETTEEFIKRFKGGGGIGKALGIGLLAYGGYNLLTNKAQASQGLSNKSSLDYLNSGLDIAGLGVFGASVLTPGLFNKGIGKLGKFGQEFNGKGSKFLNSGWSNLGLNIGASFIPGATDMVNNKGLGALESIANIVSFIPAGKFAYAGVKAGEGLDKLAYDKWIAPNIKNANLNNAIYNWQLSQSPDLAEMQLAKRQISSLQYSESLVRGNKNLSATEKSSEIERMNGVINSLTEKIQSILDKGQNDRVENIAQGNYSSIPMDITVTFDVKGNVDEQIEPIITALSSKILEIQKRLNIAPSPARIA